MSLIRLAKLLRLPYPFSPLRSVTLRWLFDCYNVIVVGAVILAFVWLGFEIGERTGANLKVEVSSDAKATAAKKAPDYVKPHAAKKVEPKGDSAPPQPPKNGAQTKPK